MKKIIFLILQFFCGLVYGQRSEEMPEKIIVGKIVDAQTSEPVMYANVVIYRTKDTSIVTGTITNEKGEYTISVQKGIRFLLSADFMGYEKSDYITIIFTDRPEVKVSTISLQRANIKLNEVDVVADAPPVEYKIDKRVINVSNNLNAASGSAVDVLSSTPSVSVDLEGNVSLRGSSNFTVLINGQPTVLDASEVLQQTAASEIKNIEIITNPSAKYDPEGTAGIINIITKTQEKKGLNGIISASIATNYDYNASILLNSKYKKVNFSGGLAVDKRTFGGEYVTDRYYPLSDTTYYTHSEGSRMFNRGKMSAKFGVDWYAGKKTTLNLSADAGLRQFSIKNESEVEEWTLPEYTLSAYESEDIMPRDALFYGTVYSLQHRFDSLTHKVDFQVNWGHRISENQETSEEWNVDDAGNKLSPPLTNIVSDVAYESKKLNIKFDYNRPLFTNGQLEAGVDVNVRSRKEDFDYTEIKQSTLIYSYFGTIGRTDYKRRNYAVYTTMSHAVLGIDYMLGLRADVTDRSIYDAAIGGDHTLQRLDFFPTLHLSKTLNNGNQLQCSYSRRVNRPRGYKLDPVLTYENSSSSRKGNPQLLPEFTNSVEFNWQKQFNKQSYVSLENYYRYRQNMITRIKTVQADNSILQTFDNVNSDQSIGSELTYNVKLLKWLALTPSATVYYYMLDGEINGERIDKESVNWRGNLMVRLNPHWFTKIQLDAMYHGPSVTAQGDEKGMLMTKASIRQDLFDRQASLIVQLIDPFRTAKHDNITETQGIYEHSVWKRESAFLTLTFTYKINNYKSYRKRGRGENDSDHEEDY